MHKEKGKNAMITIKKKLVSDEQTGNTINVDIFENTKI